MTNRLGASPAHFLGVCAVVLSFAAQTQAQTPPGAVATQWDIAAATGSAYGVADSTSTMRNVVAVVIDEARHRVFFTTRTGGGGATGGAKLGELDPVTGELIEWRFGSGLSTTAGLPSGLAWSAATGDVWMGAATTAAGVVLRRAEDGAGNVSFVKLASSSFDAVFRPANPTTIVVAPDGTAAFFANSTGDIVRLTRDGAGSQRIAVGTTGGAPRHVAVEASGSTLVALWYARPNGAIGRLRPAGNGWDRTEWTAPPAGPDSLPRAENAASLTVQPSAAGGSPVVCVAIEGAAIGDIGGNTRLAPFSTGEVRCLNVGTSRMLRLIPLQAGYPQFLSANNRGELFLTESGQDALSFLAPSLLASAAVTPGSSEAYVVSGPSAVSAVSISVTRTAMTATTGSPSTSVTNFRKVARGVVPVSEFAVGAADAAVDYVRFPLPAAGYNSPRPNSITAVVGATATEPGSVFLGESFMDPIGSPVSPSSNARITRLTFAPPAAAQAALTACLKKVATPASASCLDTTNIEEIAISGRGPAAAYELTLGSTGRALSWYVRKANSQPWLELSSAAGDTASSGVLILTLDHLAPAVAPASTPYTEILTIDDDPANESSSSETGAAPITVAVTLTVDPQPAINLANANGLTFHDPVAGDQVVFQVQNLGGGSLKWTAMSNNPGFVSVTSAGQVGRFGEMDLVVAVVTTPQGTQAHEATIYICTDAPNAGAPPAGISVEFACPHVPDGPGGGPLAVVVSSAESQQTPATLELSLQAPALAIERGDTEPQTRTLTVAKTGAGEAIDWMVWNGQSAVDAPLPALPAWITLSPTTGTALNDLPSQLTVTVNPALVPADAFGDLRLTLRIGNADGNDTNPPYQDIEVILTVALPPPTVTVPAPLVLEATSPAGATATYQASAVDRLGAPLAVTCDPASGSTFPVGTTTVTCTATDGSGTAASAAFAITVNPLPDTAPPVITTPAVVTAEAAGPAGAVVTFAASASDAVSGEVAISCSPMSGSTFPIGTTTVTCTATDAAGNQATASFPVTINPVADTTPPVVTVPQPLVAQASGPAGAVITFGASAADAVSGVVPVACAPASGSTFPIGSTTVTCTGQDAAGNQGSASFTVTVTDATAPALTLPANQTVVAPTSAGAIVTYAVSASDLVDGARPVSCTPASGSLFAVGTTTVTCTATDTRGNSTSGSFTVTATYTPPAATFNVPAQLNYKTGRLAFCNGVAAGPNWKDQGLVITNTSATSPMSFAVTTGTSFVRIATPAGTVPAGGSVMVTVSVDITGLARGVHYGSLAVIGNGEASKSVPVAVEIGNAPPTLCLTPTNTPLGTVKANKASSTKYFDVLNVGDDPLGAWTISNTATSGTVNTSVISGTGTRTISVSVKAGSLKGNHSGRVTINAPGATLSGSAVDLTWKVQ